VVKQEIKEDRPKETLPDKNQEDLLDRLNVEMSGCLLRLSGTYVGRVH
jgi:hypothetical protein